MIEINGAGICASIPQSHATDATHSMTFDTKGFDHAAIIISPGTCATDGTTFATLKVMESDTVTSYSTNMSDVVALTGGTATSTAAGFVFPTVGSIANSEAIVFGVDLRKRKRYLCVAMTRSATTSLANIVALLTREEYSRDTAAEKTVADKQNTDYTQLAKVVFA